MNPRGRPTILTASMDVSGLFILGFDRVHAPRAVGSDQRSVEGARVPCAMTTEISKKIAASASF